MNKQPELNERSLTLLKNLVEHYIQDGQPVGSRTLAKDAALSLSPATIRNVMADLEELGLVNSPHTSAGRVPTASGYRLFIDSLLTVDALTDVEVSRLQETLAADTGSRQAVLNRASQMLAELTRMAGVVTLPKRERVDLSHIEFVPLSEQRILVILVTNEQEVHNKIIHTARRFSAAELQQAANFLNARYTGRSLSEVRSAVLQELQKTREQVNQQMLDVVSMAQTAFTDTETDEDDYLLTGETNLMGLSDLADMTQLRALFEAFNQKRTLIHLLDQCLTARGVQIFIGEESGYHPLDGCSLVTAPYALGNQAVGVLGVIGPTRMDYRQVIAYVDVTAKLLSAALNSHEQTP
ncbi:MAG: heat-inducible transcriptional repressor HrcA [Methylococcales bacterium]|nr:heat-inducible transcriptional repressor HrcA [Methylococcales bacterium]